MESNGLVGVWPKAMMQAIGLNEMAEESGPPQWILVFAGDLNRSLAIHRHKVAGCMLHCHCCCSASCCTCYSDSLQGCSSPSSPCMAGKDRL